MRLVLLFFILSFTCAAQQVKIVTLTTVLAGAELYDGFSTRHFMDRCVRCRETDPVSRFFLGSRPGWDRMIVLGAAEAGGVHILARRMRRSRHVWARRLWWTPHVGLISAHVAMGSLNYAGQGR